MANAPTTTRRALLAGTATAAAALPMASLPAIAEGHPDAALLAKEAEFSNAVAAVRAAESACPCDRVDDVAVDAFKEACSVLSDVYAELMATPAQTVRGLAVKVEAAEFQSGFPHDLGEIEGQDWCPLAADIRRLAGKAVQS